jgi:hypothetical protein
VPEELDDDWVSPKSEVVKEEPAPAKVEVEEEKS